MSEVIWELLRQHPLLGRSARWRSCISHLVCPTQPPFTQNSLRTVLEEKGVTQGRKLSVRQNPLLPWSQRQAWAPSSPTDISIHPGRSRDPTRSEQCFYKVMKRGFIGKGSGRRQAWSLQHDWWFPVGSWQAVIISRFCPGLRVGSTDGIYETYIQNFLAKNSVIGWITWFWGTKGLVPSLTWGLSLCF